MLKILNKKETTNYLSSLIERFGLDKEELLSFAFLMNKSKEKLWVVSPECLRVELPNINVESFGQLFARSGRLPSEWKPTTNVIQIFGKSATKNVLQLTDEQKPLFMRGIDLELEDSQLQTVSDGYVIVKYGKDIFGVSLVQGKYLKNQVPKSRRIKKL